MYIHKQKKGMLQKYSGHVYTQAKKELLQKSFCFLLFCLSHGSTRVNLKKGSVSARNKNRLNIVPVSVFVCFCLFSFSTDHPYLIFNIFDSVIC